MWAAALVVALALALAVAPAAGAGALRGELAAMGEAPVNYSSPGINASYVAQVHFDMRAMGPLYNNSHIIIDAIVDKQAYPEGVVVVSDGHVEVGRLGEQWRALAAHYAGALALLAAALVLAVALPLAGLACGCRRACRRRPRRPFDRKFDACRKALLAVLLIALLTLLLFGVVCLFATEAQTEAGAAASGAAVRAGAQDAATFLTAASAHARHLLVVNYGELRVRLDELLDAAALAVALQLSELSHAASVAALHELTGQLELAGASLRSVRDLTRRLRAHAERLNAALRLVRGQLLQTLARCNQPQCVRLQEKHKIGQLDTEIHYSQLPDVEELVSSVDGAVRQSGGMRQRTEAGQQALRSVQAGVRSAVDDSLGELRGGLAAIGQRLAETAELADQQAANASRRVLRQGAELGGSLDAWHARYGPWRRLAARVLAGALTAALALLALGLLCGVCGRRPDHYAHSDCCNKAAGSRCLLCGVALLFVAGSVAALAVMVYFVLGVGAQRLVCDPLTEPRGNRLWEDLDRFVDLEQALFEKHEDPNFNLTYALLRCHDNRTLYEALQLRRLYDISAMAGQLEASLRTRVHALRPAVRAQRVQLVDNATRVHLARLADSGLSEFNYDKILDALETNVTSLSLSALASQLEGAAQALRERQGFSAVAGELGDAAARLRAADRDILQPMLADAAELNSTTLRLRDGLRMNHSSLREAMHYLLREALSAEMMFATMAPEIVRNMTQEVGQAVSSLMSSYLTHVQSAVEQEVAFCGPLSSAFNATRDAHCHAILMPLNGYWIALCWCLVLVPPTLAVCCRLARLYRSLDPYPGPLVEAEYLYDAYADRDNVPLANAYKAEKRSGREARRGAAGGGGSGASGGAGGAGGAAGASGSGAGAAALAAPDAAPARRYNDMAPKHWEEGPPRYLGPTEYERPPPYYYPGSGDRQ